MESAVLIIVTVTVRDHKLPKSPLTKSCRAPIKFDSVTVPAVSVTALALPVVC